MQELFTAIYGRFTADSGIGFEDRPGIVDWEEVGGVAWHEPVYEDLGGRLYLEEVPQGSVYPNATYGLVNNDNDWTFTEDFDNALIQFNLYSKSRSVVEITDAHSKLVSLFDNCSLASTDLGATWRHVYMTQDGSWLGYSPAPDSTGGGSIWRYAVEYKVMLTKASSD